MNSTDNAQEEGPEFVLRDRGAHTQHDTLETRPIEAVHKSHGRIPNTPLAASTVSFLLGCLFSFGLYMFVSGGLSYWWSTYQLGFFLASWSAFHWGEFAVTAGWNREKCSIDCELSLILILPMCCTHPRMTKAFLLENGMMYHLAHSVALLEYLATLLFKPSFKAHPYISAVGMCLN